MTGDYLSHCIPFHTCQIILTFLLWLETITKFVCGITFVVVVVVVFVVVAIKYIYSCLYEDTSYTQVVYLCMSEWCDNANHDLPQHVRRLLKWRFDRDGNKCRSIIVSFISVIDTVSIRTCHYMLFPFLILHVARF